MDDVIVNLIMSWYKVILSMAKIVLHIDSRANSKIYSPDEKLSC